jgi:hypothetical protein
LDEPGEGREGDRRATAESMGTKKTTVKSILVVFEGDGTLWWRPPAKERVTEGDLVTRGKQVF